MHFLPLIHKILTQSFFRGGSRWGRGYFSYVWVYLPDKDICQIRHILLCIHRCLISQGILYLETYWIEGLRVFGCPPHLGMFLDQIKCLATHSRISLHRLASPGQHQLQQVHGIVETGCRQELAAGGLWWRNKQLDISQH